MSDLLTRTNERSIPTKDFLLEEHFQRDLKTLERISMFRGNISFTSFFSGRIIKHCEWG